MRWIRNHAQFEKHQNTQTPNTSANPRYTAMLVIGWRTEVSLVAAIQGWWLMLRTFTLFFFFLSLSNSVGELKGEGSGRKGGEFSVFKRLWNALSGLFIMANVQQLLHTVQGKKQRDLLTSTIFHKLLLNHGDFRLGKTISICFVLCGRQGGSGVRGESSHELPELWITSHPVQPCSRPLY